MLPHLVQQLRRTIRQP